jgi:hypothetical protein
LQKLKEMKSTTSSFLYLILAVLLLSFLQTACKDDDFVPKTEPTDVVPGDPDDVTILDTADVPDFEKYYKPKEFSAMNMLRNDSRWSFVRSKQSEHFFVFWEAGFGSDPNASTVSQTLRVDIDDLLAKAEIFYDMNINTLKFAETGIGKSNLDKYKMQIYLHYTSEWMAYGGGYDDIIGGLWVNPATCKPVGSTIAHEIGHSFQYQVYADLLATGECQNDYSRGFRYGYGGNGGNGFWEQCAQWQSLQSYPGQVFTSSDFPVYVENYHRHICHEWHRYASYFIHYYWTDKHGIDMISKIWRESVSPEDPIDTYMRLNGLSVDQLNEELYNASARFASWDIDAFRDNGNAYIGKHTYKFYTLSDGRYQVAYSRCPGSTGYNVIPLNVPESGMVVTTSFAGLQPGAALAAADPGVCKIGDNTRTVRNYNSIVGAPTRAGWRYGYVALLDNGQRVYGDMHRSSSSNVEFTVPENCERLWFVVLGAPSSYLAHPWDEDESNDDQWPYTLQFTNTDILGNISVTGDEEHENAAFTFDINFPASSDTYPGASVTLSGNDLYKLARAFVLQPSAISAAIGKNIKFYAVESDGALNATTTANGYGHWFNATGNVCGWGTDAKVYSEFAETDFTFTIGQYPEHCTAGDKFTISQALVYEYEAGKKINAIFVFNITIK